MLAPAPGSDSATANGGAKVNNLNSVLIEGKLETDPELTESNGKPTCSFKVLSLRKDQAFRFRVVTRAHLAEVCAEYLRKDRGVRIVGQLHEENDRIWIVAEHVEFKPTAKEKG
jgi:hypothetical protein